MAHVDRVDAAGLLRVTVVYGFQPGQVDQCSLALPAGSTVAQAVLASGVLRRHPEARDLPHGVWGRLQPADHVLREGDRVELYRALTVDPKEARRQRYRAQGPVKRQVVPRKR